MKHITVNKELIERTHQILYMTKLFGDVSNCQDHLLRLSVFPDLSLNSPYLIFQFLAGVMSTEKIN